MTVHKLDEISSLDLSEAPRIVKQKRSPGAVAGISLVVVLLLGLLIVGSLPELSPEEIISMDGYQGEQPITHIFNLESLEKNSVTSRSLNAATIADPDRQEIDNALPIAVTEAIPPTDPVITRPPAQPTTQSTEQPTEQFKEQPKAQLAEQQGETASVSSSVVTAAESNQPSREPAVTTEDLPIARTEPVPESVTDASVEQWQLLQESVPQAEPVSDATVEAAIINPAPQQKVTSATATTPTIEEANDTVVVASIAAPEPVPLPAGVANVAGDVLLEDGGLLPLRSVIVDATELKVSPAEQAETVLSFPVGATVSVFETSGEWAHVGANDGSSTTGYVLESSLGPVQ